MPTTPHDAKGLLVAAVEDDNPVIYLEHRWLHGIYGPVPEEIYRVPLVIAGPGITTGTCNSTVNFHDLCPTICELAGALPIDVPDSKSLFPQLRDPTTGAGPAYAENHGSRYRLTQRILWDGCWKFVFNGFDFDELCLAE